LDGLLVVDGVLEGRAAKENKELHLLTKQCFPESLMKSKNINTKKPLDTNY